MFDEGCGGVRGEVVAISGYISTFFFLGAELGIAKLKGTRL